EKNLSRRTRRYCQRHLLSWETLREKNLSRRTRRYCQRHLLSWETLQLKKRAKKLEKKRRSKSSGLKRLRKVERGGIEAIDADKDITLVDAETQVNLGAELQGRKNDDNVAIKGVSAAEPTVFDDEEVTMTMAQTLIKMKAEKARLFDEQMDKRLHDEEVEQATARKKQEKNLSSHPNQYTSPVLTQKLFANMRRVEDDVEVPAAQESLPIIEPSPPPQEPITTPPQAQPAPPSSPP
nr:hypothetical protein [Tanacetum cinerariifolium]